MSQYDQRFKVVVVGGEGVGKTQIINAYTGQKFQPIHHGTDAAKTQTQKVDLQSVSESVVLTIMDLPGNPQLELLNRMYLRDAHAAIIVYDLSDQNSLEAAKSWAQELDDNAPEECIKICCGNKDDTKQESVSAMANEIVNSFKMASHLSVSAKNKENIDRLFLEVAQSCYDKRDSFGSQIRGTFKLVRPSEQEDANKEKSGQCC